MRRCHAFGMTEQPPQPPSSPSTTPSPDASPHAAEGRNGPPAPGAPAAPTPATARERSLLATLLAKLTPGYFDHVGMNHLSDDAPAEVVDLVASLHVAHEAVLALGCDAVRAAEAILHNHTEGPQS